MDTVLNTDTLSLEDLLRQACYAEAFCWLEAQKNHQTIKFCSLEAFQKKLSECKTCLYYYAVGDQIFALVIGSKSLYYSSDLGKLSEVSKHIERLNFIMLRVAQEKTYADIYSSDTLLKYMHILLEELYHQLIRPLEPYLSQELLICPYGVLNNLPFAALYDGQTYLSERYLLSLTPSASLYVRCKQKRLEPFFNMVVFGLAYPDIPLVESEVKAVAKLFEHSELFSAQEAHLQQFRQKAATASLLHIATHGVFHPHEPAFAGLRFYDGWLTARALIQQKLKADLVVLSACETALHAPSNTILSMAEGFLLAGSSSLVASLWAVKDGQTAHLMIAFYAALKEGKNVAEALQQAQAVVRLEHPNPYYWAAFNVLGDSDRRLLKGEV